jgi:hypothetical protein
MSVAITDLAHIFLPKIIFLVISDKLAFFNFISENFHTCLCFVGKGRWTREAYKGEN